MSLIKALIVLLKRSFYLIDKQRQEQMNRLLAHIESNIEENIQTESDCQDQLRNFLEMRRKFIRENDKPYNSLKFSNQIIAGSEEGNHQNLENETHEIEKIAKFLSLDQDLLTEKQRRRLFELQGKVLRLLRGYLNKSRSRVKQKAQGNKVILSKDSENNCTRCEITLREENSQIERKNESVKKEKLGSFEKNYRRYYESLRRLKKNDLGSFKATIGRLKNLKPKGWLLPHLNGL